MSVGYHAMREGQEDAVALFVRQLLKDLGYGATPALSGDMLKHWKNDVHVTVADQSGVLVGVCVWFMTYSTFRGQRGMHVSDLYVLNHMRGQKIGENLLRVAAKEAEHIGAAYIKLEVGADNTRPIKFYGDLGFELSELDRLMFLEPQHFKQFAEGQIL